MARAPVLGDRMIVVKEPYTSLIMDGTKILELRCRAVRGEYYLADSTTHTVKGRLTFGQSRELSQEEYENTRDQHCVKLVRKRYKKTVGTIITSVQPVAEELAYKAKSGAIGFARFQPAIPKTLRIIVTRDDSLGENNGGVVTGAVDRLAAKVMSECPRSGAAVIQEAPARRQSSAGARSKFEARS